MHTVVQSFIKTVALPASRGLLSHSKYPSTTAPCCGKIKNHVAHN